jgi:hypothetical protein
MTAHGQKAAISFQKKTDDQIPAHLGHYSGWGNILVHSKQIVRIVLPFNLAQAH